MRLLIIFLLVILFSCNAYENQNSSLYTDLEIVEIVLNYPDVQSLLKGQTHIYRTKSGNDLFRNVNRPIAGFEVKSIEWSFLRMFKGSIGINMKRSTELIEIQILTDWKNEIWIKINQELQIMEIKVEDKLIEH